MNWSTKSIAGRRENNEDCCGVYAHEDGTVLLALADGMGGHQAGEVASSTAINTVRSYFEVETSICAPEAFLKVAATKANMDVYRKAENNPLYYGMGTTLVLGLVTDGVLFTANVGDSRLYVSHQGRIMQITKDHAFVQELIDSGVITESEAKVHPLRHMITRCIGNHITTDADIFITPLSEGDIVLLCSDGLSGVLDEDSIRRILCLETVSADILSDRLVTAAYDSGSTDNISVCIYIHHTEASA